MITIGYTLFSDPDGLHLSDVIVQRRNAGMQAISDVKPQILRQSGDAEILDMAFRFSEIVPLVLDRASATIFVANSSEAGGKIASRPPIDSQQRETLVIGIIPYKGDQALWRYRPSISPILLPRGLVEKGYVMLGAQLTGASENSSRKSIKDMIVSVAECVELQSQQIRMHNTSVGYEFQELLMRQRRYHDN